MTLPSLSNMSGSNPYPITGIAGGSPPDPSTYISTGSKNEYNAGAGDIGAGLSTMQPSIDYFRKLLSGNPADVASAMQPQSDVIANQFSQIRNMFSTTGARGGGTSSTLAQLPFQQIKQLQDVESQQRANAAGTSG